MELFDERVWGSFCLSLSLCLSASISPKPHVQRLPVAVARTVLLWQRGDMLCRVLPVLWKTSYFPVIGPTGRVGTAAELCWRTLVTGYSSMQEATPLRKLTCHVESHSVTCHPAEVTFPPLPPAEAGTRFSDPGGMQGWVLAAFLLPPKRTCSGSYDRFNFWQITNNILESVHIFDKNTTRKSYVAWRMTRIWQVSLIDLDGHPC